MTGPGVTARALRLRPGLWAGVLLVGLSGFQALAEPPRLALPVDCELGKDCFIQQYVDRDPGPGTRDVACNDLTYDGHKGTDFALPHLTAMNNGVAVRAAAPGKVLNTRDGMDDQGYSPERRSALAGRECGNGAVIAHADGWQTQYCHLKQGSLQVRPGQTVETGTVLGQIGQSGNAAFPHLHLSLRDPAGRTVDPFNSKAAGCEDPKLPLWSPPIPYVPAGLVDVGLTTAIPAFDALKRAPAAPPQRTDDPAIVLYTTFFGPRAGDRLHLALTGPDGPVLDETILLTRDQARAFRAIGKRRSSKLWPPGTYTGAATLIRNDVPLDERQISLTLR